MNKFETFECLDCDGEGQVFGYTGDGETYTWDCPDCNNGWVDHKAHLVQVDSHEALKRAQAKEDL